MTSQGFPQLLRKLKTFYDREFSGQPHFTVIYGSQAYGDATKLSDLDMFTVVDKPTPKQVRRVVQFTLDLHRQYGLGIDTEVGHDKKLVIPLKTFKDALAGLGFRFEKGHITVAPIVKTREYLDSPELIRRLTLNAITSKNLFVSGDKKLYDAYRQQAEEAVVRSIFSIQHFKPMNPKEFVQAMLYRGAIGGEEYLGYKDRPHVRKYLTEMVSNRLRSLVREGKLRYSNSRYSILDPQWMRSFQSNYFVRRTRKDHGMPPRMARPGVPARMLRRK